MFRKQISLLSSWVLENLHCTSSFYNQERWATHGQRFCKQFQSYTFSYSGSYAKFVNVNYIMSEILVSPDLLVTIYKQINNYYLPSNWQSLSPFTCAREGVKQGRKDSLTDLVSPKLLCLACLRINFHTNLCNIYKCFAIINNQ